MLLPVGVCLVIFGTRYAALREAALKLDELGYDSVWVWDHYVSWHDPTEPVLEGLTTLAAVAEATQRVQVGTLVANNNNRHPGRLAKIAATMQEISGGRFALGIGAGGLADEQEQFGISHGDVNERVGRITEALQIIPHLWRGAPVSFAGHYYHLANAHCFPPPEPPPPIIVGANGPRMARLAGLYADGVNIQWHHRETFPATLAALDTALATRGRTRAGFDLSLHIAWDEFIADPQAINAAATELGVTRIIPWASAPFPLDDFVRLAASR